MFHPRLATTLVFANSLIVAAVAAAAILSAPAAHAETYTDGGGGKTFVVGSQPTAGLTPIDPGVYNVRIIDPSHMTTYGGQWSTCQKILCGNGYEDNFDRTGIILPKNSSGVLMEVKSSDVAVYLFDVIATRVQ